jgi:hypothetical protein
MGRNTIVFHSKKKETRMARIRQNDELALRARRPAKPSYAVSTVIPVTNPSVLKFTSRHEMVSNSMLRRFVAQVTE